MEENHMNDAVKLGLIGLGPRGQWLLNTLLEMDEIEIAAICDKDPGFNSLILDKISKTENKLPDVYTDYNDLLARQDISGVIIATNWVTHVDIAVASMKAGKYAGVEVGGEASIDGCWRYVRAYEETKVPCMLLENCCYGKNEMTVSNMINCGVFGEILHCECGYNHDLRKEMMELSRNRLQVNMHRNGDLYPTHGLGPIAQMLSINRGNRFVSLCSMASKAAGFKQWLADNDSEHALASYDFVKGDVVQTMIKCAHGETVLITHNVSAPRPISRLNMVQGTRGAYSEEGGGVFIEGITKGDSWEPLDSYHEKYAHSLWKQFEKGGIKGGHGGMDYLVMAEFAHIIREKTEAPIDAYDTATWRAVTVLSEQSIAMGGAPVAFPDFTNGKWVDRK